MSKWLRIRLPARRTNAAAWALIAIVLVAVNGPSLASGARHAYESYRINSSSYKRANGHWSILRVPKDMRLNAIHAALLYTGKVLVIAGSGNDLDSFKAGTFKSLLWDPATNTFKRIHTPSDLFCGGHAFLPDGKLLIAGGTKRYEVLATDVTRAAGVMTVRNESPDYGVTLPVHSLFVGNGVQFRSAQRLKLPPAKKIVNADGQIEVKASSAEIWVEAVKRGRGSVVRKPTQYTIQNVAPDRRHDIYGLANTLTMRQQDFWGQNASYLFDPATERYEKVGNLTLARWYPTLVSLGDGRVLAVSGLDQFGRMIPGDNEIFDPQTRTWQAAPRLQRTFPTYPALFPMPNGELFYSGSNAGYGSATVGRTPGIWNLTTNTFRVIPGLRDPTQTETSGSVLLPPAQKQRYMVVGGGGVGDSPRSTARIDVVDLNAKSPRFTPGPDLARPTRYPNLVITPDDKVVISGGSSGYRGAGASDLFLCYLYDPASNRLRRVAKSSVGRDYHSEALLLPDGRELTMGGNPLFGNKENTAPGTFEKRFEVYSPPYLYRGVRPTITGGPTNVTYGEPVTFTSGDAAKIARVRLIHPSAATHVTNLEQRSIELSVTHVAGGFTVTIPSQLGLVPRGWYMLFALDARGTPSVARWLHVGVGRTTDAPRGLMQTRTLSERPRTR
jgi:hypothetical protein